jgi:hypothetical protein
VVNIISKQTIESKVSPGVSFTIRRPARHLRAKRDLAILDEVIAYRSACWQTVELLKRAGYTIQPDGKYERSTDVPPSPEVEAEIARLDNEITTRLSAHIMPASIKTALLSIEGVEVDGVKITTAEELLQAGPEVNPLLQEIYDAIEAKAPTIAAEQKEPLPAAA